MLIPNEFQPKQKELIVLAKTHCGFIILVYGEIAVHQFVEISWALDI